MQDTIRLPNRLTNAFSRRLAAVMLIVVMPQHHASESIAEAQSTFQSECDVLGALQEYCTRWALCSCCWVLSDMKNLRLPAEAAAGIIKLFAIRAKAIICAYGKGKDTLDSIRFELFPRRFPRSSLDLKSLFTFVRHCVGNQLFKRDLYAWISPNPCFGVASMIV